VEKIPFPKQRRLLRLETIINLVARRLDEGTINTSGIGASVHTDPDP
jgi:hypothetical protein